MSGLNLVPNPAVLVVQAGVFLANVVVVKKLFLEPYLNVYRKRQGQTVGSREETERVVAENAKLTYDIERRLEEAMLKARKEREEIIAEGETRREKLMLQAEIEAKRIIEESRSELQTNLKGESAKITEQVASLTEAFYQKIMA